MQTIIYNFAHGKIVVLQFGVSLSLVEVVDEKPRNRGCVHYIGRGALFYLNSFKVNFFQGSTLFLS